MIIKLLRKVLRYLVKRKERKERIAHVKANPHKWMSKDLYDKYQQMEDTDERLSIANKKMNQIMEKL
jgi:hypothetical protein